jgi:hypothetical protein
MSSEQHNDSTHSRASGTHKARSRTAVAVGTNGLSGLSGSPLDPPPSANSNSAPFDPNKFRGVIAGASNGIEKGTSAVQELAKIFKAKLAPNASPESNLYLAKIQELMQENERLRKDAEAANELLAQTAELILKSDQEKEDIIRTHQEHVAGVQQQHSAKIAQKDQEAQKAVQDTQTAKDREIEQMIQQTKKDQENYRKEQERLQIEIRDRDTVLEQFSQLAEKQAKAGDELAGIVKGVKDLQPPQFAPIQKAPSLKDNPAFAALKERLAKGPSKGPSGPSSSMDRL